jgi:hypothetical protein
VIKVVGTDCGTRSKVLIMVFLAFKTFDPLKKVAIFLGTRSKVYNALKSLNNAFLNFRSSAKIGTGNFDH